MDKELENKKSHVRQAMQRAYEAMVANDWFLVTAALQEAAMVSQAVSQQEGKY